MSDPQAQPGIPWRSPQQSSCQSLPENFGNQGNKQYSVFGEGIKLIETEKSYSVLSFNGKEENLLKKKLSFLESMKKHEATAWLMEQKAFYKRCHSKLLRSELAHARLFGNKELVKQLTSKNTFSNYNTWADESEAAVKAIVQNGSGRENNKMLFQLSLNKGRHWPALSFGLLQKGEVQGASRGNLKEDSEEEGIRATAEERALSSGHGNRPALVLSLESLVSTEPETQQRNLGNSRMLLWAGAGMLRDSSKRCSSTVQNALKGPAADGEPKGTFLQYIVRGRSREHPKAKRPRPRQYLHDPEDTHMVPTVLTQIQAMLRQGILLNGRAKCLLERVPSPPQSAHVLSQDSFSKSPLDKEVRELCMPQEPEGGPLQEEDRT